MAKRSNPISSYKSSFDKEKVLVLFSVTMTRQLKYLSIISRGFLYNPKQNFKQGFETIDGIMHDHDVTMVNDDVIIKKSCIIYKNDKYIKTKKKSRQKLILYEHQNYIAADRINMINGL